MVGYLDNIKIANELISIISFQNCKTLLSSLLNPWAVKFYSSSMYTQYCDMQIVCAAEIEQKIRSWFSQWLLFWT